ncbi:NAD(P)H-quinone oxidoreductase [Leeia sp. TBRC 13508]|uniref:NAD(P)H-quinone oxidoreductase n=1 Tax=Leeia speluncae TaxID=2884804 RepID=A0ABS8D6X5_9NEIS|nr:NAD(P)H-quinone oxidoreductase [Leeia speluncae]MCB6183778.1 NAD(P)H-quinone oxidoreductase [Leeia speluncae]
MKQIQVNPTDQKLIVTEVEIPTPAKDEVLIKVFACGVNRMDLLQRQGHYPIPPTDSTILGVEVSGEVIRVGSETNSGLIGKPVCTLVNGGGYAEFVVAKARMLMPIPEGWTVEEAAAYPEAALTIQNTVHQITLKQNQNPTILVHGGTSGIGVFAVQQLKGLGYKVITTVGSETKKKTAYALGCDLVINYNTEDFELLIKELAYKVDVVLDMVAGSYTQKNINVLNEFGHLIIIAFQGGRKSEVDIAKLLSKKITIKAVTLRSLETVEKVKLVNDAIRLNNNLFKMNKIKPVIGSTFSLQEAERAHEALAKHSHVGKIILKPY